MGCCPCLACGICRLPAPYADSKSLLIVASCLSSDFQKADLLLRSPAAANPAIRMFWTIWGNEQLCKHVFPVTATAPVVKPGPLTSGVTVTTGVGSSLSHLPVKEGLTSIIKCLKAQDFSQGGPCLPDNYDQPCSCQVCKTSKLKLPPHHHHAYLPHMHTPDTSLLPPPPPPPQLLLHSAFYPPALSPPFPMTTSPRTSSPPSVAPSLSTPYSDALKAAATAGLHAAGSLDHIHADFLARIQLGYHRLFSSPVSSELLLPRPALPTTPADISPFHSLPTHTLLSSIRAAPYPAIYRPRILTHNIDYYTNK